MAWLEITINTASKKIAFTATQLTARGFADLVIEDQQEFEEFLDNNHDYWDYVDEELSKQMEGVSQIRLYVENGPEAMEQVSQLRSQLASLRETYKRVDFGSLEVAMENLQEEDWENNWKQYYRPTEIGERLMVVPKWLSPDCAGERIPVLLDPGMIFGTGNHASTRMCMMELERLVKGGEHVLDLGSGSGILSITALLLGAQTAAGVDIDPKAEDIARENASFNNLGANRFAALTGNVLGDEKFLTSLGTGDLVLANIVADVIIPLAPLVPRLMKENATFVCSGVLQMRLQEVLDALDAAGLAVQAVNRQEDWCQITAVRKEA